MAFPLWLRVAGTGFWESEDLAWFSAWWFSVWGPGFLKWSHLSGPCVFIHRVE